MIKCINTKSLDGYKDYGEMLDRAMEMGFHGLEVSADQITLPKNQAGEREQLVQHCEELTAIANLARERDIAICSVTSSHYDISSLVANDEQDRNNAISNFDALLRWAGSLSKADHAIVVVISAHQKQKLDDPVADSYEKRFNLLFKALDMLTEVAESESTTVALENPASGLLLSPLELRELIDQINSPYLGICFNPYHAQRLGDPLDWLRILSRRIVALRLLMDKKRTETFFDIEDELLSEFKRLGGMLDPSGGPIIHYTDPK